MLVYFWKWLLTQTLQKILQFVIRFMSLHVNHSLKGNLVVPGTAPNSLTSRGQTLDSNMYSYSFWLWGEKYATPNGRIYKIFVKYWMPFHKFNPNSLLREKKFPGQFFKLVKEIQK